MTLNSWIASLTAFGGHAPAMQAVAIILATFILEDAATVMAAMEALQGTLPLSLALVSLFVGIVLGDLGLYGLGRASARLPWLASVLPAHRQAMIRAWLTGRVFRVVATSRFLPGLRLPTYTTCGFLGADLRQFALGSALATLCWTSLLFGASLRIGAFLMAHFGAWRWAGAAGFVVFIIVAGRAVSHAVQGTSQ